jgi:hypothetical protein
MKLNPGVPMKKAAINWKNTFHQQIGLKFKDETSEVLHLEHSTALTLRKVEKNYLESFETWCWRRMEKISWPDRVRNAELLPRVKEERDILHKKKS